MKKNLYSFILLSLLLTSCSNNDNTSSSQDNLVFPKTITLTYPNFPQVYSKSTITYDGNKIVTIVDAISITKFTYDGNKITKQEEYNIKTQNTETLTKRIVYEYENGKLKTRIAISNFDSSHPEGNFIRKQVYTYRTDGVISYSQIDVNTQTKAETKRGDVNLTYKLGNLIRLEEINVDSSIPNTIFVFEYDNKNNPLKNILGFDLLYDEVSEYGINNKTKTTVKNRISTTEAVYNSSCIYNSDNYLTKIISFTSDGKTPEYQTEYTY